MTAAELFTALAQILQPLKNARLVVLTLLANFVLVPPLAYVITLVIPLEQLLRIGLLATVAWITGMILVYVYRTTGRPQTRRAHSEVRITSRGRIARK